MLYQRLYRVLTEHRPFVRKGSYFGPVPRSSMPPPAAAAPSGPAQQDMVFL